jgi:hypothetical protein
MSACLAVAIAAARPVCRAAGPPVPDVCEEFTGDSECGTVSLWLFDEPYYPGVTLTDAGSNWYDLRLEAGGLCGGWAGNALVAAAAKKPAAVYANDAIYPVGPPDGIISCLSGQRWTVEFRLNLRSAPDRPAEIIGLCTGGGMFAVSLSADAAAFTVEDPCGVAVRFPVDRRGPADGRWHHVAITGAGKEIKLYLDGRPRPAAETVQSPSGDCPFGVRPGVVGVYYGDSGLANIGGSRIHDRIDFDWGDVNGKSFSQRFEGRIRAPATGMVTFLVEANVPAELAVGGEMASVCGHKGLTLRMSEGKLYDFGLRYSVSGRNDNFLRLLWKTGGEATAVPAGAYYYTADSLSEAAITYDPYNFRLGSAGGCCEYLIDELRISNGVRYAGRFEPPASFSRNLRREAACDETSRPGPVPLFGQGADPGILAFGARKHVFIDDAIIEQQRGLRLVSNPPGDFRKVSFDATLPCEGGDAGRLGFSNVLDLGEKIALYYKNFFMWTDRSRTNLNYVALSADGLNFAEKPVIGSVAWRGSKANNVILAGPVQGNIFFDANPAVPAGERFKLTGYFMGRGIYLFLSPDGLRWRRNETIMLPFDCGGGVETFWDDQRSRYAAYIRHEGFNTAAKRGPGGPGGRAAAAAVTKDPLRPWPFEPLEKPFYKAGLPLPSVTSELPVPFYPTAVGQPYRTRAVKYPWAPDTFLAFVWRIKGNDHSTFVTELAASRDGLNWKNLGEPLYMPGGWEFEGRRVVTATSCNGLVRRGDEIWQYASLGLEDGRCLVRAVQRLDGFTCLEAGPDGGWAVTRPMVMDGSRLELNAKAGGCIRVGVLNTDYLAVEDFATADCDAFTGDSVRHAVTWRGRSDLDDLRGRVLRLRFELADARLFAFEVIR